jgi:hypothetical protein
MEEYMKKWYALLVTALMITAICAFSACRNDPFFVIGAGYDPFPEEEILGATFYISDYVTSEEAGSITKNADDTYTVRMRRRSPSYNPAAMFISGPFEFSDYFAINCEFPENAAGEKPYRVYACASTTVKKIDDSVNADYPTAADLQGQVYFRNGVAIGEYELTNRGVNTLTVKRDTGGNVKPYCSVFLYLYFNQANMADPNDYYTFTIRNVSGANSQQPLSPVIRAAAYRNGDTDPDSRLELAGPVLPDFDHRFDSKTIPVSSPASLNVDIQVPDTDAGREFEFVIRGLGMYSGGANQGAGLDLYTGGVNRIAGGGRIEATAIVFESGTGGEDPKISVTENTDTLTMQTVYLYTVKAKAVPYSDFWGDGAAGTGVKLKIPGSFSGINRYTVTLNLPREYL